MAQHSSEILYATDYSKASLVPSTKPSLWPSGIVRNCWSCMSSIPCRRTLRERILAAPSST